ncbi:MAG: DNA primase [Deltaproteobacteria bacterium]|nr:DNA primase [Deltaproteobacteria bacterium]
MQIPPEKIQEILERTDIVALISRHVELKRAGRSFKGLCPFHGEKTPSFHVNPDRRYFKCFGCEAGGDAISFLTRFTGRSFVEVVHDLAKEAGVGIEEREDPAARERAQLREANALAQRHFEERLWTGPAGAPGREHLEKRGVGPDLARRFGLGYAPLAWNDLSTRLVKEGILEWGAKAGLVAPQTQSDGYYDVFRGRLTIPIRSSDGRVIAFGGRLVEHQARPDRDPPPKYLNSRESPVYRKSETLYALDVAKDEIRKRKTAILVEGYFDVIGLFSAGVQHAVALCSTALTTGHLGALAKAGAEELVLLLDGDSAGMKAVERLAAPLLASGVKARVATLPEGDDPDTFALREGSAAVEQLVTQAPGLSTYLLERALPQGRASAFEEKMAALARFLPLLEAMAPGMARTLLMTQLADHLGVPESEVRASLRQELKPKPAPKPARPQATAPALDVNEELFAALLVADSTLRDEPDARFRDEIRSLEVRVLLESERPVESLPSLGETTRKSIEKSLQVISATMTAPDARRKALHDASVGMRLARLEERRKEKIQELSQAQSTGASEEELSRLQLEHRELNDLRMRLKQRSAEAPEVAVGARAMGSGR